MKHFKKKNLKHIQNWKCRECDETKEILLDEQKGEIFCWKCGLVLYRL